MLQSRWTGFILMASDRCFKATGYSEQKYDVFKAVAVIMLSYTRYSFFKFRCLKIRGNNFNALRTTLSSLLHCFTFRKHYLTALRERFSFDPEAPSAWHPTSTWRRSRYLLTSPGPCRVNKNQFFTPIYPRQSDKRVSYANLFLEW